MAGKNRGGRPRSTIPPELAEQLGPPPLGQPLRLARWYQDAIASLTWLVAQGRPYAKLLETMRASAGAAGRVLPHDILFEAARILNDDANATKNTWGGPRPIKRSEDPLADDGNTGERKPSQPCRRQPD
jgi:hypothetical protein